MTILDEILAEKTTGNYRIETVLSKTIESKEVSRFSI